MNFTMFRIVASSRRRVLGAVIGGLVTGLILAVWMLVGEVFSGEPSQLTVMERQVAGWFGVSKPVVSHVASAGEEYWGLAGHLLLSAAAGLAYGMFWRRNGSVLLNGLVFGVAFFVVCHAIVGPIIGLTPLIWNIGWVAFLMGCVINGVFGLCTAWFADFVARDNLNLTEASLHAAPQFAARSATHH